MEMNKLKSNQKDLKLLSLFSSSTCIYAKAISSTKITYRIDQMNDTTQIKSLLYLFFIFQQKKIGRWIQLMSTWCRSYSSRFYAFYMCDICEYVCRLALLEDRYLNFWLSSARFEIISVG